jgi:hypothetical protein
VHIELPISQDELADLVCVSRGVAESGTAWHEDVPAGAAFYFSLPATER